MRRTMSVLTAVLGLVLASQGHARADYPDKPIRLVLPFPAGGAVDIVARMFAAKMADDLGKPIVIENKAGAGGIIATDTVAKAPPDGYTLLLTTPNHTIIPALQPSLPYDTEKDLVPVSVIAEVPEVLVSHPSAPFSTFAGFVAHAKKSPGLLNYASAGTGTLPHVTMELLLRRMGIEVAHIPYRGAAPAMTDLLAGVVQLKLDTYTTSNPHVAAGKLHMLGIASRHRSKLMPNTPTIAEMGLPGYEGILWIAILAPAGTPQAIIDKLAAASAKAARAPDIVKRLQRDGVEPVGGTPSELATLIARELPQWRELAKAANIKLQ
ncbi:MAG: tripartite tricarboxylate transporter substrate binding protein [Xanthobacteraceae bacterium]|nr:tripartite tricarboxylate transporter substrate binding protein [Xanthobacteraceae bacterium]